MRKRDVCRFLVFLGLSLMALSMIGSAWAVDGRWQVTIMHPEDGLASKIYGISGGRKVGFVTIDSGSGSKTVAALWNSDTNKWVQLQKDLVPSIAYAVSEGEQVGYVAQFGWVWDGGVTDGTFLKLPETNLIEGGLYAISIASGVSKGWQVGAAVEMSGDKSFSRAVLWHGTTQTPVLLHDGEAYSNSSAQGIYGATADSPGGQVGYTEIFDGEVSWNSHAALWNGTAASRVDLNPANAKESAAFAGYSSQQVGYAQIDGQDHAILWNGAADKYVDLNPACADMSYAHAIFENYQAGYVYRSDDPEIFSRAWLWEGSAEKYVDLHELLPPEYIFSQAWGVEVVNGHVYVVGSAYNYATVREEAIMWHLEPFGPMIYASSPSNDGCVKCGNLEVESGQGFSVSIAFAVGFSGSKAVDWWFIAYVNETDTYYYMDDKGQWQTAYDEIRACRPVYSGPLFDIAPTEVLTNMILPPNTYTFSFGVSYPSTGIFEGGILVDEVNITVKP